MFKFLFKTVVTVGIVGLALEGVKKVLENREEANSVNDDAHSEAEFITITPSTPTETTTNIQPEPVETTAPVTTEEPVATDANPVEAEEKEVEPFKPTEESIADQTPAE